MVFVLEWTNPTHPSYTNIDTIIVNSFELEKFKSGGKFTNYIVPIQKTLDWIRDFNCS